MWQCAAGYIEGVGCILHEQRLHLKAFMVYQDRLPALPSASRVSVAVCILLWLFMHKRVLFGHMDGSGVRGKSQKQWVDYVR